MRKMLAILGFMPLCLSAAETALTPQDFSYGMTITVEGTQALFSFPMPMEAYRRLTRSDAGDMRIFNGAGEMVPYTLRQQQMRTSALTRLKLPYFPIYTQGDQLSDEIELRVIRSTEGKITEIKTHEVTSQQERRLAAYIIDASAVKKSLHSLILDWRAPPAGFMGNLEVSGSHDLNQWHSLAADVSIAEMTFAGHQLKKNSIDLNAETYRYLRVSWPSSQDIPAFNAITAAVMQESMAPRQWGSFSALTATEKKGEYLFSVPPGLKADRLRVEIPTDNRVLQVEVLSRVKTDQSWQHRHQSLLYHLDSGAGGILKNTEMELNTAGVIGAQWLLRFNQESAVALSRSTPPAISLGWIPEQVVFVAQGQGPFLLAYGASDVMPAASTLDNLLNLFPLKNAKENIKKAQLGMETALGGNIKLMPHQEVAWKKWILWGVLIAGVLLLAWMSRRLLRQLQQSHAAG